MAKVKEDKAVGYKAGEASRKDVEKDKSKESYTWDEIKKHNKRTDCWVVIKLADVDEVYDLTEFVNEHPGGAATLYAYAGKNADFVYHKNHHRNEVDDELKKYLIGRVA